jgi:hypothetical protein
MTKQEIVQILADLKIDLTLAKDPTWYPDEGVFNESLDAIDRLASHLEVSSLVDNYVDSYKSPNELWPELFDPKGTIFD